MDHTYHLGYTSLNEEIDLDNLPIRGSIPAWLSGSLLRNGPAKFEVGEEKFAHWFDGFAMLHRFTFHDGHVSYANKFLQSDTYKISMQEGRIAFSQFATDPCKAVFKGSMTVSANANVSINKVAGDYVAMTETPLPVAFNPHTLETLGVVEYDDQLVGHHGSAHPHYDFARQISVSYMIEFGQESKFHVYSIKGHNHQRTPIGSYIVPEPPYIHSFGMTEHYIVIAEFPYRVNPLDMLTGGKPFIENYVWRPDEPAFFVVMSREDGSITGRFATDAFFSYHHINAFERDGEIIVDLSAYPDISSLEGSYLEQLRSRKQRLDGTVKNQLRRYRLSPGATTASYEVISEYGIELPTINYRHYNARDYGVAYGVSMEKHHPEPFLNLLVRVDMYTGITKLWSAKNCYPGEPIFVASPEARAEDDGVILSVVLDANHGNSFLLVLDAHTFEEIGRAEVPHHIPFGFHGQFFSNL